MIRDMGLPNGYLEPTLYSSKAVALFILEIVFIASLSGVEKFEVWCTQYRNEGYISKLQKILETSVDPGLRIEIQEKIRNLQKENVRLIGAE